MSNDNTSICAWYYAVPYFFLTFVAVVLTIIAYYKSTQYISKKAIVSDIMLSVYMNTPPPYTMTSKAPLQGEAKYQYKIDYEHNGKTYNTIIENMPQKMNIGDTIDIVILKKDPYVLKTEADFSDMLILFIIVAVISGLYSIYVRLLLMSHTGRLYLCASGIISSVKSSLR